ncbi:MAG: double-strand break repair protein AddB [Pseudomonadota bacterium]
MIRADELLAWDAPHLFSLPPGRPFFDDLVATLLADLNDLTLPQTTIFLPSRRAVRALRESFSRRARGETLLLPRLIAIADLSEDDALSLDAELRLGPLAEAPGPSTKRLKLAGIYRDARARTSAGAPDWATALRAADELSRTYDLLTEHEVTSAELEALGDDPAIAESAEHWREVLSVIGLASEAWPQWLKDEGLVDARRRRKDVLAAVAGAVADERRGGPAIAAGFIGTTPSSAAFLAAIAKAPLGAVVLPGLDRDMTDLDWSKIEAPHPQYAYKEFLEKGFGGLSREGVRELSAPQEESETQRRRLVSLALTPAETTDTWYDRFVRFQSDGHAKAALHGLEVAIAADQEEEADFVALTLRSVLAEPGKSAFLVTADRTLGRRVAAKMRGWGIDIDDSGGAPLSGSFRATFLRLVARLMATPSDPIALAGLIHHQLFGLGLEAKDRVPMVRSLDQWLRGRPPRDGWDGLKQSFADPWRPAARHSTEENTQRALGLIERLASVFQRELSAAGSFGGDMLRAHVAIAAALAARPETPGEELLFRYEDGEALDDHLKALKSREDLIPAVPIDQYPDLFDALLQGPAFRPPGGQHPRLAIYGVLEARLQTADLVIVSGLQEGVWPGDEVVDPFLSRGMRRALGLPSPDEDVGRVAHDFANFASTPNVLLTRSERQGRSPAKPSRFMVRLESFLKALGEDAASVFAHDRLRTWAHARYEAEGSGAPAPRPAPAPHPRHRPRKLSVSEVGTWRRDPYAIYAKRVLGLRPLQSYNAPFSVADRGTLLHALLENAVQEGATGSSETIAQHLRTLIPSVIDTFDMPRIQRILNNGFLDRAVDAFAAFQSKAAVLTDPLAVEVDGRVALKYGDDEIIISARADRIDRATEGYHLIDYKTGAGSSLKAEAAGFSPQLFLSAMIAKAGGFEGCAEGPVWQISFLPLSKATDLFKDDLSRDNTAARGDDLAERLAAFEAAFRPWLQEQVLTPSPMPSQVRPFESHIVGDYDHLARRGEWLRSSDG